MQIRMSKVLEPTELLIPIEPLPVSQYNRLAFLWKSQNSFRKYTCTGYHDGGNSFRDTSTCCEERDTHGRIRNSQSISYKKN